MGDTRTPTPARAPTRADPPAEARPPSVLVCRDCCCGTDKHPEVDHDAQLEQLRAAVPDGGRFWRVGCLGPCEAANVVVVRSGPVRRWFGHVLTPERTDRLADWIAAGAPEPVPAALRSLEIAPDDIDVAFDPLDVDAADIAELVVATLEDGAGSWSVGVLGAVGEWFPDDTRTITVDGDTITAATTGGDLRLGVDATTRAYAGRRRDGTISRIVLAGPPVPVHCLVNERGPDGDGWLVDLGIGIGSCSFMMRADAALRAQLAPFVGGTWQQLLDGAGGAILAASPPRVITSNLGRLEVRNPIPPPDGRSPDGSHTHLLPAELELGRELLTGFVLAPGLHAGATFYADPAADEHTAARWQRALRRRRARAAPATGA